MRGGYVALVSPTVKVSNVPLFVPDADIARELSRFGRIIGDFMKLPLNCKSLALKRVVSFRGEVIMILNDPALDISFQVLYEGRSYMLYASTGSLQCFECGDIAHERLSCPHKNRPVETWGMVDR